MLLDVSPFVQLSCQIEAFTRDVERAILVTTRFSRTLNRITRENRYSVAARREAYAAKAHPHRDAKSVLAGRLRFQMQSHPYAPLNGGGFHA